MTIPLILFFGTFGSLGIGGKVARFWGVGRVAPPPIPQNLALTTANPKESNFLLWAVTKTVDLCDRALYQATGVKK